MDYNSDGFPDLVIGEYEGKVFFYRNRGVPGEPLFSDYSELTFSGEEIDVFNYARPCVVDWNNDGELDLVLGHSLSAPTLFLNDPGQVLVADMEVIFNGPLFLPMYGGNISFDVTVTNPNSKPITLDFFTSGQCAPRGFWGPTMNYQDLTLNPGQQVTQTLLQYVPTRAPYGFYDCAVFIGDSSNWQFLQSETFWFHKGELVSDFERELR